MVLSWTTLPPPPLPPSLYCLCPLPTIITDLAAAIAAAAPTVAADAPSNSVLRASRSRLQPTYQGHHDERLLDHCRTCSRLQRGGDTSVSQRRGEFLVYLFSHYADMTAHYGRFVSRQLAADWRFVPQIYHAVRA